MTAYSPAFDFERPPLLNTRDALFCEVQSGLRRRPRSLSPRIFYDAHGSHLFELITELPEYLPMQAERNILASFVEAIIALARVLTNDNTSPSRSWVVRR